MNECCINFLCEHNNLVCAIGTHRTINKLRIAYKICPYASFQKDCFGATLLHVVSSVDRVSILNWLLKYKKVDVALRDWESGWTSLHRACFYGNIGSAVLLSKFGANWHCKDRCGMTPFDLIVSDRPSFNITENYLTEMSTAGTNFNGTLGHNSNEEVSQHRIVEYFYTHSINIEKVAIGEFHSVFLSRNGSLYVCGFGLGGRLGLGESIKFQMLPKKLSIGDSKIQAIAGGRDHTVVVLKEGIVYSWGSNEFHQLGYSASSTQTPRLINPKSVLNESMIGVCCGTYHSIVYNKDKIFAFGRNRGQFGLKRQAGETIAEPTLVTCIPNQQSQFGFVTTSDLATVCMNKKGEIYCMRHYECKKILLIKFEVKKLSLFSADGKNSEESAQDSVVLFILAENGNLYIWRPSYRGYHSVFFDNPNVDFVLDIAPHRDGCYICCSSGQAYCMKYINSVPITRSGIPLLALELGIGQRLRKGPWQCYSNISRFTFGMGIASVIASLSVAFYYNTVIAWCLYYLVSSFSYPLPWSSCPKVENTTESVPECAHSSEVQYFWNRQALDISPSIGEVEGLNPKMSAAIVVAWIMLFMCMFKGIKSQGKVIYFTSTFPYVLLTAFLIKGLSLKGATEGLVHLFKPDFSALLKSSVWLQAAEQIFYSLGLAGGSCIAMASYTPLKNNFLLDTICIALVNTCTSLYAACVIFALLGSIATSKSEQCLANHPNPDEDNIDCSVSHFLTKGISGTGLAFMTMAEGCTQFGSTGPFWAIAFYLMLIMLGLDSTFGTLESIFASILDFKSTRHFLKTEWVSFAICSFSCLMGLVFALRNGEYIFQMFDDYAGAFPFVLLGIWECIAVGWVYGMDTFSRDIQLMTGWRPPRILMLCWMYISPLILTVVFIFGLYSFFTVGPAYKVWDAEEGQQLEVPYPLWAKVLCLILTSASVIWMPLIALFELIGIRFPTYEPFDFPVAELREAHPDDNFEPTLVDSVIFRLKRSSDRQSAPQDDNGGSVPMKINNEELYENNSHFTASIA